MIIHRQDFSAESLGHIGEIVNLDVGWKLGAIRLGERGGRIGELILKVFRQPIAVVAPVARMRAELEVRQAILV